MFDYRYVRLLGEGANGKTWLAKKLSTGDWVAIKALKLSQVEDLKSIELFKREAAALQGIDMEGVPKFYESIFPKEYGDVYYIVQEYIHFPSIADYIKQHGPLDEQEVIGIMEQLAFILVQLHTRYAPPVIHRDIKPSNILYNRSSKRFESSVYLIDFGAVANPQKRGHGSTIAGTFGYMAPEQLLGDVSVQSDFYAVGATMLHMLTGVAPYQMSSDVFKLQYEQILNEKAPKTSVYMKQLLMTLLAPEIENRPQDAIDLLRQVQCVLEGRSPKESVNQPQRSTVLNYKAKKLPSAIKQFMPIKWPFVQGVIRKIGSLTIQGQYDNYLEYTFTVDGTMWCGIWLFHCMPRESLKYFVNIKPPIKCTVGYNKKDPRLNCLADCEIRGMVVPCYKRVW